MYTACRWCHLSEINLSRCKSDFDYCLILKLDYRSSMFLLGECRNICETWKVMLFLITPELYALENNVQCESNTFRNPYTIGTFTSRHENWENHTLKKYSPMQFYVHIFQIFWKPIHGLIHPEYWYLGMDFLLLVSCSPLFVIFAMCSQGKYQ